MSGLFPKRLKYGEMIILLKYYTRYPEKEKVSERTTGEGKPFGGGIPGRKHSMHHSSEDDAKGCVQPASQPSSQCSVLHPGAGDNSM
ncbi:hypothetical protein ZHAS_00015827 [Anopheles sinensis]|uniref:Uncharacterized protein n=1 Tax=Anopheles sinensis TaxID=74873 RepID=A0A084WC14_ANOSI|nr:hypothetical protein ZHAS_00015827 [Anopheles sinensis]